MSALPPFMRSVAHATLSDLSRDFRRASMDDATEMITDLLEAFSASENADLFTFTRTWLATREQQMNGVAR